MKSLIIVLLLFVCKINTAQESRLALVIGNANYEKGKLKNPVNDALLMQSTFENLGFDVIIDTNIATRDQFYRTISTFLDKRITYDVAFIYYAGHAVQIAGENYMLAIKEAYNSERDAKNLGININAFIEDYHDHVANKINVLIIDACRNNPFEQSWTPQNRSLESGLGLAEMKNIPTGTIIAYSTQPGYTASDGKDKNSLYCLSLAQNFMLEGVRIEDVFAKVKKEVRIASSEKQKPTYTNELEGTAFYLKKSDLTKEINEIDSLIDDEQKQSLLIAREKISALLTLHPNDKRCLLRKGRLELYNEEILYDGSDLLKAERLFPNDFEVKQYLARYYKVQKKFKTALDEINKSIELNPENPESYDWKIKILLESGDTTGVLEGYSKIIELEKNNPKRYEFRANYYFEQGDFDNALIDLNKAIELTPTETYFLEIRANFFIQKGDYINALNDLDKAIEISPTAYNYNNRADFYKDNLNDHEEAIKDYKKAIQNTEETYQKSRSLNNLGLIYYNLEKYDLAVESYSKAIALSPEIWNPYSNRADSYSKLEKFEFALQDYTKAMELDAENKADRYNNRAQFFIQQGDNLNALKDLDKAIELSPTAYNYNNRADFYKDNLNDHEKAIKDYEKAIQLTVDPFEKSRSLNNLGLIYYNLEKYDLAIESYSKAIALSTEIWNPYSNRADSYSKLEKFELALQDYKKAIELDAENKADRYDNRAQFFIQQGDNLNALKDLDKAIEISPTANYYNNRADFYTDNLYDNEKAIKDYEKAIQLTVEPFQKSRSLNNLGLIYYNIEKYDLAIESYSQAIALSPEICYSYSNRADLYSKLEKFELALQDYTKAIELDKENKADRYDKRAQFFIQQGDNLNALKDLDKAIELSPTDYYYNNRADFYKDVFNDNEKAIKDYEKAIQNTEETYQKSRSLNNLGLIYYNLEKYDLAVESYSKAIALSPEIWNPYSNRADSYSKLEKFELAYQDYTKAIELDAENKADRYDNRAQFFIQQGDNLNALKDLDKAIEISPTSYHYNNRADFYKDNLNDHEKAIKDYEKAIQNTEETYQKSRSLNNLGLIYYNLEKYDLAVESYSKAIALSPEIWNPYSNRADSYSKLEKFELALQDHNKVIDLDESNPNHYISRGDFYNNELNKPIEALVDYSIAITIDSSDFIGWWNRGLLLSNKFNDHKSAIEDFKHIVELDTNDVGALNWIGVFYDRIPDEFNSINYFNKVISKVGTSFTDSIYSYGSVAWSFNNLGNKFKIKEVKDLANKCYENAIKYDSLNAQIHAYRAWFLERYLKNHSEALLSINKSIELEPNNPDWHLNKAKILLYSKDFQNAEESFKTAIEKSRKSQQYISELANFYSINEEHSKADKFFDDAFKSDSVVALSYHLKTEHLIRQNKLTEAIKTANQSQTKFKNDTVAFEQLGRIFMLKKDYLKSLKAYEHALAIMEFNEGDRNFGDSIIEIFASDICLALHEIYTILNDSELACDMLAKAEIFLKTEIRPDNLELEVKINSLRQKCPD